MESYTRDFHHRHTMEVTASPVTVDFPVQESPEMLVPTVTAEPRESAEIKEILVMVLVLRERQEIREVEDVMVALVLKETEEIMVAMAR